MTEIKFKKGDRVKRVVEAEREPERFGEIGATGTVEQDYNCGTILLVRLDGVSETYRLKASSFELVDAPRFKEGDRVRVVTKRHGPSQYHDVGTVELVDGSDDVPVHVTFDDRQPGGGSPHQRSNCYDHADLELYVEPPEGAAEPESKLKVGDRIVSLSDRDECGPIEIGETFVVTGVDERQVWFNDRNGHRRHRPAPRYRLATATDEAKRSAPISLVIAEGKNYRLRNGAIVGPIHVVDNDPFVWAALQDISEEYVAEWDADGRFDPEHEQDDGEHLDIVAEWIGGIPEIKEGDRVVNICDVGVDLTIGAEYEVVLVAGDEINFRDDVGDARFRYACRYRLAGQPLDQPEHAPVASPIEPEGPPAFAVGDLIRSVSDTSDDIAPGDTFTATGIEEDGAGWLVSFTHPISGERTRYAARYERVAA